MIKKVTIIAGVLLGVAGLLGFVDPNFLGLSLTAGQGTLYLFSGAAALYFGLLAAPVPARTFSLLFGSFYALLGMAGLGLGEPRMTIIPGQLAFETLDHLFHLILGAAVLAVALSRRAAAPLAALTETKQFARIFQHANERTETSGRPPTQGAFIVNNKH